MPTATSTTTTTVVAGSTTTSPPVQSSSVQVQISGSQATISFASSDVSGSLSPQPGTFSQGGTVYEFVISGVQFTGASTTQSQSGGLISSVTVSSASGGAAVTVKLTAPASHSSYGLGHNEVGVIVS